MFWPSNIASDEAKRKELAEKEAKKTAKKNAK
jgi:hypothetical protein